jgi:hypothetical protein
MPIQQARTKPQQLDRPLGLGTFYTSMEPPDLVVCFTIVYCMIAVIVLYLILLVNMHVSCTDMHHAGQQAARDRIHTVHHANMLLL